VGSQIRYFKQMCVFLSKIIYRTTFCNFAVYTSFAWLPRLIIITIITTIDVKHHAIIRDTGDEGVGGTDVPILSHELDGVG